VYEFIAAVRLLQQRASPARFVLVGEGDTSNPGSVTAAELLAWRAEELVELWGWSDDMAKVLKDVDVVVLPAYREGLPKSLLEAASCALPIVTTDTPGCNDVVVDGENGLLVQVGEVGGLADAIERLVADKELRHLMGRAGRERVLAHFSESIIVEQTLTVYSDLLAGARPALVAAQGAAVV
jgi:glycosyltransferase involved in cell wall biosynthesis